MKNYKNPNFNVLAWMDHNCLKDVYLVGVAKSSRLSITHNMSLQCGVSFESLAVREAIRELVRERLLPRILLLKL